MNHRFNLIKYSSNLISFNIWIEERRRPNERHNCVCIENEIKLDSLFWVTIDQRISMKFTFIQSFIINLLLISKKKSKNERKGRFVIMRCSFSFNETNFCHVFLF